MKIELAYDTTGLIVDVPERNLTAVLRHGHTPPLEDASAALTQAVARPLAGAPLVELARGRRSACIVICDHTRPAPDSLMLPPLLAALAQAGLRRQDILILIATGLHRPSTPEEIQRMVGPEIAHDYRIENHDGRDESAHRLVCTTSDGTTARIDRRFLDADLKIATGFVEPHLMAGFGGGRKMVGIGIASAETICQLHSPRVLEDRRCREGNIEGNLLHRALTEIAAAAGLEFIVHVTMDEKRRVTGAFAGPPAPTFDAAVAAMRKQVAGRLEKPCDVVITSGGGLPLDATFYQTIKGITAALPAVRPGGTVLVASGCREGLGSEDFCRTLRTFVDFSDFRRAILDEANPYFQIDQWQCEQMSHAAAQAEIVLGQSKLTAEQRRLLWIDSTERFADALSAALVKHGSDATVAVLPQGPYVLVEPGQPDRQPAAR